MYAYFQIKTLFNNQSIDEIIINTFLTICENA
jgi:hypothetical protein